MILACADLVQSKKILTYARAFVHVKLRVHKKATVGPHLLIYNVLIDIVFPQYVLVSVNSNKYLKPFKKCVNQIQWIALELHTYCWAEDYSDL